MTLLADQFWVIIAIIAAVVVLSMLHVLANAVYHEQKLHDLRVRVNFLRSQHLDRIRSLESNNSNDVEIVEDVELLSSSSDSHAKSQSNSPTPHAKSHAKPQSNSQSSSRNSAHGNSSHGHKKAA